MDRHWGEARTGYETVNRTGDEAKNESKDGPAPGNGSMARHKTGYFFFIFKAKLQQITKIC